MCREETCMDKDKNKDDYNNVPDQEKCEIKLSNERYYYRRR
jgi:hypothetical protein